MPTVNELEQIKQQLQSMNTDVSEELASLVSTELARRNRAGRKSSGVSRREQNRLAQQRFREKRKEVAK